MSEKEKHNARVYTQSNGQIINWEFIRLGILSVADQTIFPLQDFMNLGSSHRMNFPGTSSGNWLWRYTADMLSQIDEHKIISLIELGNRKFS